MSSPIPHPCSPNAGAGDKASGDSVTGEMPEPPRNSFSLQSAHQSIVAGTVNNAQDINFVVTQEYPERGAPTQAINASRVDIHGQVSYNTHAVYIGENTTARDWLFSLSPLKFEETQYTKSQVATKAPEAGRWLLQSQEFIKWRDGDTRRLWCYGIPGAGKTILASIIINHLETNPSLVNNNAACIYVYFDYRDQKRQDLPNLLSSLLIQLVRKRDEISSEARKSYLTWKMRGVYPTPDEYLGMLKSQVRLFPTVFIIIDALDECRNDSKTPILDDFLKALRELPQNVHLLFTSRDDKSIERKVRAESKLKIVAENNDMKRYLENRIDACEDLKHLVDKGVQNDKSFLDKALKDIVAKSQGMFLLAHLHMNFLASKHTLEDFQSGLDNLPQTPDQVYKIALERISSQNNDFKRNLAINVLTWLVFAERQLTIQELIQALAIHHNDRTLVEGRFVTEETLTSACAGMVVIDQENKSVSLAHYTAEQYLRDNAPTIFQDAQSKMAETCLVYLSFDEFSQVPSTKSEVEERKKKYPFLSYAANHWGDHLAFRVRGRVYRLAYEFLINPLKVMSAFQFMANFRFRFEVNVTGLHVAAYFGLDKLAGKLLKMGFEVNATTQRGETALHWAAYYGQAPFIELLINRGADLNVRDNEGKTALQRVIFNDDIPSLGLLLSLGGKIDLEHEDSQGYTALRLASAYGKRAMVEKLLRSGAQVDAEDKDGWTALRWAAHRGHLRIIRLLVQSGASVETLGSDPWTLLIWAAKHGQESIIRLLVEKQINLDATDARGWTALHWAVYYGRGMTAWSLIRARADVNKADNKGWTPLHSAAERWAECSDKSLVWLLLESGAEVDAPTKLRLTALQMAASRGHSSLVWLLLEKGADPKCADNNGRTALHCAAVEGQEEVTRMLLQKAKILVNLTDDEGQTALHVAASTGNIGIVLLLLENKAHINLPDRERFTPLHRAVSQQHEDVVYCLAKNGASINIPNQQRFTALTTAESASNLTILRTLRHFHRDS